MSILFNTIVIVDARLATVDPSVVLGSKSSSGRAWIVSPSATLLFAVHSPDTAPSPCDVLWKVGEDKIEGVGNRCFFNSTSSCHQSFPRFSLA